MYLQVSSKKAAAKIEVMVDEDGNLVSGDVVLISAILHYLVNFRLPPQVDADGNPVEGQEELAKIILQQQQLQVERIQSAEKRGIK